MTELERSALSTRLQEAAVAPDPRAAAFRLFLSMIDDPAVLTLVREVRDGQLRSDSAGAAVRLYSTSSDETVDLVNRLVRACDPGLLDALVPLARQVDDPATIRSLTQLESRASAEMLTALLRLATQADDVDPIRLLTQLESRVSIEVLEALIRLVGLVEDPASFRHLGRIAAKSPAVLEAVSELAVRASDDVLQNSTKVLAGAPFAEDLCISAATSDWASDPEFASAYDAAFGISAWGTDIRWRVRTLTQIAQQVRHLPGNFVECGVDRGGTALATILTVGEDSFANRRFFLFDTFQGLVDEQLSTEEKVLRDQPDRFPDVWSEVQQRFSPYPFVELVRGVVPESLNAYDDQPIAYLHIDLNAAEPEVQALRHLWPQLVVGAAVVFDDYGFPGHRAQRDVLAAAASDLGFVIIESPTGQGIGWKVR